jgi:hypothetical protein
VIIEPNLKIFWGELQVYDMNFGTVENENFFVRTAVFGGGSISGANFCQVSKMHQHQAPLFNSGS